MTVFTPKNLWHFRCTGFELRLILVPDVTILVKALQATNALQHIGTKGSSLGRSHTTLIAEGRTGSQKGYLSLYSLGNPGRDKTSCLITKYEVIAREVCTQSFILGRDLTLTLDVFIYFREQCHRTVAVSKTLLHTLSERSARLVEVGTTVLGFRQQRHAVEYTIICITAMSLKQIIIEDRAQTEGFTLQAVYEHLLLGNGTGCPRTLVNDLEEEVDILDTVLTIVPL